jgi:DNA-directed RNA polymerase subunit RPC12/RpoP
MQDDALTGFDVTLKCSQCGNDVSPVIENPTDESIIVCPSCSQEIGSWADIKATVHASLLEKYKEGLKESIGASVKGIDGVTFKPAK